MQKIFQKLYEKGDIYKGVYKGHYCKPCESFWTDSQLVDGKCPDCGREVYDAEEEAYFFRISNYSDRLLQYYEDHPDFIQPASRKNEMIAFIGQGLQDTCVSRTSVKWGIPVTFDPSHTIYVWIDALSNYITALGYGNTRYDDYDHYWPADIHMVFAALICAATAILAQIVLPIGPVPFNLAVFGAYLAGCLLSPLWAAASMMISAPLFLMSAITLHSCSIRRRFNCPVPCASVEVPTLMTIRIPFPHTAPRAACHFLKNA